MEQDTNPRIVIERTPDGWWSVSIVPSNGEEGHFVRDPEVALLIARCYASQLAA